MAEINNTLFRNELERFQAHLRSEGNQRILFSGAFGIGKTTFLNYFFNNGDVYYEIKINPVNYSIASNEDILKYIKYDILVQLFSQEALVPDPKFAKERLSALLKSIGANRSDVIPALLKMIPKIGSNIADLYDVVEKLSLKTDKEKKQAKSDDFIAELIENEGSIFEANDTTVFINDLIQSYAKGKTSVLIIDDLDRIEPEHILRLLNVFGSLSSTDKGMNKFGFDKVILVCDVNNLKEYFLYKYGPKSDFEGYIDKFYSSTIFEYNDDSSVVQYIRANQSIKFDIKADTPQREKDQSIITHDIKILLKVLFLSNSLNLRTLLKPANLTPITYKYLKIFDIETSTAQFSVLSVISYLVKMYGSPQRLIEALNVVDPELIDSAKPMFKTTKQLWALWAFREYDNLPESKNFTDPVGNTFQINRLFFDRGSIIFEIADDAIPQINLQFIKLLSYTISYLNKTGDLRAI